MYVANSAWSCWKLSKISNIAIGPEFNGKYNFFGHGLGIFDDPITQYSLQHVSYDDIVVVGKHAIRFFDNFQFLLFDFSSPELI